jgi:ElaB/YqjD/DUF883 family membrane-anchored ribosome-binding protein
MKTNGGFVGLLFCIFCALAPDVASAQVGGAVDYVAMVGVLQQLKQSLDSTLNTANQAASDRIHQADISIDQEIKNLQDAIKKTQDGISVQREEIFKQAFDVIASVNDTIQSGSRILYIDTNSTLVSAATIVGSIPFVNVPDFVFAADPVRFRPNPSDHLVSFYGYFPSVERDGDAEVEVGGQTYPLKRYTGNKLGFDIPQSLVDLAHQSSYIDMTISLPRRHWYQIFRPTVHNRIYVEKQFPFHFVLSAFKDNPDLWATVKGNTYKDNADSSKTSVAKTLSAVDMFSLTVGDNTTYDQSTATIVNVDGSHVESQGTKPCDCCDGSSGSFGPWSANQVAYSLSAPTCGAKHCSLFYFCGGGGTHVEVYIAPTFKVKKRNVPEIVPDPSHDLVWDMTRSESKNVTLGDDWNLVRVDFTLDDGDDKISNQTTVTKQVPVATDGSGLYSVAVDATENFALTTRK